MSTAPISEFTIALWEPVDSTDVKQKVYTA